MTKKPFPDVINLPVVIFRPFWSSFDFQVNLNHTPRPLWDLPWCSERFQSAPRSFTKHYCVPSSGSSVLFPALVPVQDLPACSFGFCLQLKYLKHLRTSAAVNRHSLNKTDWMSWTCVALWRLPLQLCFHSFCTWGLSRSLFLVFQRHLLTVTLKVYKARPSMTPLHLLPCVCFHTDKQHVCGSSKHKHIWAATREQQQQTPGVPLQPARADRWFSSLIASISLYRANKQLRQPHPRWRTYMLFLYLHLPPRPMGELASRCNPASPHTGYLLGACTRAGFSLQTTSTANIGSGQDVSFPRKSKPQPLPLSIPPPLRLHVSKLPNSVCGGFLHAHDTLTRWTATLRGEYEAGS